MSYSRTREWLLISFFKAFLLQIEVNVFLFPRILTSKKKVYKRYVNIVVTNVSTKRSLLRCLFPMPLLRTYPTEYILMTMGFEVVYDLSSPVVRPDSVGRFTSGRFCRVYLGTGECRRPQGAIPPGFYPLRRMGLLPGAWSAPNKGNADGTEDNFGLAGCMWASVLQPDPP